MTIFLFYDKTIYQGGRLQSKLDKQASGKNEEIARILNKVYNHFKEGLFEEASVLLEKALQIDFEYKGVTSTLKCATFWKERKRQLPEITGKYEKAEFIFSHWKQFSSFISQVGEPSERCVYNIKQYIFGTALGYYLEILDASGYYDGEVLLKVGRCYKAIGDYDNAVKYLGLANQQLGQSSQILAELGDCYSLVNEVRISKALFREAFFVDPGDIDLDMLES